MKPTRHSTSPDKTQQERAKRPKLGPEDALEQMSLESLETPMEGDLIQEVRSALALVKERESQIEEAIDQLYDYGSQVDDQVIEEFAVIHQTPDAFFQEAENQLKAGLSEIKKETSQDEGSCGLITTKYHHLFGIHRKLKESSSLPLSIVFISQFSTLSELPRPKSGGTLYVTSDLPTAIDNTFLSKSPIMISAGYMPIPFHRECIWSPSPEEQIYGYKSIMQLSNPRGMCIHPKTRNIYVADYENDRIVVFSSHFQFLFSFGLKELNSLDMRYPSSINFTPDGNHAIVTEKMTNRIRWFNLQGEVIRTLRITGSKPGELRNPNSAVVDCDGNIFVADTDNRRIQKFTSNGDYITHFGNSIEGHDPARYSSLSISTSGDVIYAISTESNQVRLFDLNGVFQQSFVIERGMNLSFIACINENQFMVSYPESQGVLIYSNQGQVLSRLNKRIIGGICIPDDNTVIYTNGTKLLREPLTSFLQGNQDHALHRFTVVGGNEAEQHTPDGISVHPSTGFIYVSMPSFHKVQIYSPDYKYIGSIGDGESYPVLLSEPSDIVISPAGDRIAIVDMNPMQVLILTGYHRHIATIPLPHLAQYGPNERVSICFDISGLLYIAHTNAQEILKFDCDGNRTGAIPLRQIAGHIGVSHMACLSRNELVVTCSMQFVLITIHPEKHFVIKSTNIRVDSDSLCIGRGPCDGVIVCNTNAGSLSLYLAGVYNPLHLGTSEPLKFALDSKGKVYIVSANKSTITVF